MVKSITNCTDSPYFSIYFSSYNKSNYHMEACSLRITKQNAPPVSQLSHLFINYMYFFQNCSTRRIQLNREYILFFPINSRKIIIYNPNPASIRFTQIVSPS